MRFEPIISNNNLGGVTITYDGNKLNFNMSKNNGKRVYTDLNKLFSPVNHLLSNLSTKEKDELYGIYENIHDLVTHKDSSSSFDLLIEDLTTYITGIFELLPLDGILAWSVNSYADYAVPETIGLTTTVGNYPRSTSYNIQEYLELCGLSTALKLTIPITYGFMYEFKNIFGTEFKDYNLLCMMRGLNLEEYPPFTKLLAQAETALEVGGEIKVPMGLLEEGIGSGEYPLFAISSDVIRTLCLAETDIKFRDGGIPNNITAKLTSAIKKNIEGIKKRFNYADNELPKERAGSDAGNTSNREVTNAIQRYSDLYGRYFNKEFNREDFYKRFGIKRATHQIFRSHVSKHPPIGDTIRINIIGLTFPKFANVEALTLLPDITLYKVIGDAAARLHDLGFHNLVNLLLSKEDSLNEHMVHANKYVASDAKVSKDLLDTVRGLYEENSKGTNGFEDGLRDLVSEFCKPNWITMSPADLHESYGLNISWVPDRELKSEITKLTIHTLTND